MHVPDIISQSAGRMFVLAFFTVQEWRVSKNKSHTSF